MKNLICHLATSHRALDNRIFYSEMLSLKDRGYECHIIGIHPKEHDLIHNISITGVKENKRGIILFFKQPILVCGKAFGIKCEIFHFHDPALLIVGIVLKLFRKSVIYDVHDDYEASVLDRLRNWPIFARVASKLWWFFEHGVCCCFDGLVVADRHLEKKFKWKNPAVLGNYPRMSFIPPSDISCEKNFNIIYVGGISEARGIGKLLEAIDMLPYTDIRLLLVGECRDTDLLVRIQNNSRVDHFGRVAWTDLHRYYIRAHMGVALYQPLASFIYCPGENSVKIIEYMAAGLPVLCSNFPGLKIFVEDSGYGLTVNPDDPKAIADKICYLYENRDISTDLGRNGRRAFEAEYNWEKHEAKLIELYERILGEKPHTQRG